MSLVGALALGLGLAAALEYFDRTMRSESDVNVALNLPVLAVIPFVQSAAAARRRAIVAAVSLVGTLAVGVTGLVVWSLLK